MILSHKDGRDVSLEVHLDLLIRKLLYDKYLFGLMCRQPPGQYVIRRIYECGSWYQRQELDWESWYHFFNISKIELRPLEKFGKSMLAASELDWPKPSSAMPWHVTPDDVEWPLRSFTLAYDDTE